MASNTPLTYLPIALFQPVDPHLLPPFIPNLKSYHANFPIFDNLTYYLHFNFLLIFFTPKVKFITSLARDG
jgi:hypothetical protein